jgi:hypothetical protein
MVESYRVRPCLELSLLQARNLAATGVTMTGLDYWRLCDELTVIQAALLIVDRDPSELQEYIQSNSPQDRPLGYDAALAALTHAILSRTLSASIRRNAWLRGYNEEPEAGVSIGRDSEARQVMYEADPAWDRTTVAVDDLRAWLRTRGFASGFFFPQSSGAVPYLDPKHPNYAPKLAAAISAWEAMSSDLSALRNKSPKQALMVWLRKNADQFALTKDDGYPNEQGIEDVAKVANWDTKGGAPKTPGE